MSYLNINTQIENNDKTLSQNSKVRRKKNVEDIYKALKPKAKEYRQSTDIAGLYCRVQQNGKKSWQYRYKTDDGKWRWMGLGSFPSVSYVKAREKAEGMSNGTVEIITQAEIKQTKLQEQKELFANLMYEWLDRKKKTWAPITYLKEKQLKENIP